MAVRQQSRHYGSTGNNSIRLKVHMRFMIASLRWCLIIAGLLLLGIPLASAQEDTLRDPISLAERYLGYDGSPIVPPATPIYEVGDTLEFWVSVAAPDGETPVRVQATLAAAAPSVYIWVEDGLEYAARPLGEWARQLSSLYSALQLRQNYTQSSLGSVIDPTAVMHVPDVDNDPHLYVLYTSNLGADRDFIHNPMDSLPAELVPGGYSNQHEMIYINTAPFGDEALHDPLYQTGAIAAIYDFIMSANNPTQAPWLLDTLNFSLRLQFQRRNITAQDAAAFLEAPETPILRLPALSNRLPTISGQQMFLNYFAQRYGIEPYIDLFLQPGEGLAPLDAVLQKHEITDLTTGAQVTGLDAFADFVMANLLNFPFGDGRYVHLFTPLEPSQRASATEIDDLDEGSLTDQPLDQFGTRYVAYVSRTATSVVVNFEGSETIARLPMPFDFDGDEAFYWSGRAPGQDRTMTHAFDLTETEEATLTFNVWHDLANEWNYGYVSVSTDGGETWTPLPSTSDEQGTMTANRHALAYGPAFTGISNPEGPRPFPIMGVVIGNDGMTLGEISPDSPAEAAGLQPNDRIIGYDGELWQGAPNVLGLLSNYAPGDTVNLYIQRGNERLDVPLVLGAHPTRVVEPSPLWLEQSVDLTPFTGQEILLRFEYVSVPGRENGGFAVNDIAIPEIDFEDDGEWILNGWQEVTNTVPQRWLVQAGIVGTSARVRPQIGVGSDETSGEWTFSLQPNEVLLIAISAVNDDTYEQATFDLEMREG